MQNNNNSRRDFLKKVSIVFGSIVLISGFDLKKSTGAEKQIEKSNINENHNFKTVSSSEANDIIKKANSTTDISLKPEPAPFQKQVK